MTNPAGDHPPYLTRTHYNYFRDYEPAIGRYVQSDPIGLRAGLNTYAYVESTPLLFVDLVGLQQGRERGRDDARGRERPEPPRPGLDPGEPKPREPSCFESCMKDETEKCPYIPVMCFPCAGMGPTPATAACAVGCGYCAYMGCKIVAKSTCSKRCGINW